MLDLLLVEDDLDLATSVIDYYELEDIQCDHAINGLVALNLIEQHPYQVIILDINLPQMNGLAVCKSMRDKGIDTPVIMLTAMDTLDDKLSGFAQGADDYLVKPFAMEELIVRVQALSKRRSGQVTKLTVGTLELDISKKMAYNKGKELKLSPIELKILEMLLRKSPKAVSRNEIIMSIWGDEQPKSNSLKVHLFNLRKQIAITGDTSPLRTITGYGFAIDFSDGLDEQ